MSRENLISKVKKQWCVDLKPYKTFNGKRYRLMGAGIRKGLGDFPRKKGRSFRTITVVGCTGKKVYATYLYGRE